ncbi:MAG: hypothetical protein ACJ74G_14880 [Blastocatellia bacterium]
MERIALRFMVCLLMLGTMSCFFSSKPATNSSTLPVQASSIVEDASTDYKLANAVVWEVDEKGTRAEAKIEVLSSPPKDHPTDKPLSRLTIRNVSTQAILFSQESDDSPVSMYIRPLNEEVGEGLVVVWSGGSADRIEILKVDAEQSSVILKESYRIDAAFVDLSGAGQVDVFITTGEGGNGPFYTTRYVWKKEHYEPVGKIEYKKFINTINSQFKAPLKIHK